MYLSSYISSDIEFTKYFVKILKKRVEFNEINNRKMQPLFIPLFTYYFLIILIINHKWHTYILMMLIFEA